MAATVRPVDRARWDRDGDPGQVVRLDDLHPAFDVGVDERKTLHFEGAAEDIQQHVGRYRLRLEAEIIRDAALTASGLLTSTIGGESVFPPQPAGIYVFTQDDKKWKTDVGPNRYRRSMYIYF